MAGEFLEITAKGRTAKVRRVDFAELSTYESTLRKGDDFGAKVALFKKISEQTGEPIPKAIQVSIAAAALRHAGDGLTVTQLDEDEIEGEAAEQYAAASALGDVAAYSVGDMQIVCKAPASDVLQVYYKTSDKSAVSASRGLAVWCMSAMGKAAADAAAKRLDARYPGAYITIANALAELGGLTVEAEVREL